MPTRTITTETELDDIVDEVLSLVPQKKGAQAITLSGQLGAGKTTFVQHLAEKLGVHEHPTSPTFVIMRQYPVEGHAWITTLTHIDAYRIDSLDEMRPLRFAEELEREGNLICIEWPEQIASLIPRDRIAVTIVGNDDGTRTITYGN